MVNPAALFNPHMPAAMLGRRCRRVRPQLVAANAAVFLLSTAGSIVIYYGAADPSGGNNSSRAAGDEPPYVSIAFLLFLLGIWLVLLALVADGFRAAATLGEAIAVALRGYFFGRRP